MVLVAVTVAVAATSEHEEITKIDKFNKEK